MTDLPRRLRHAAHHSDFGDWSMAFAAPPPALAGLVRRCVAYAERDTGFVRRRELPNGQATLLFNLGDELRIEHPPGAQARFGAGGAFFSGAAARYAVSETDRAQQGVQAMFSLVGARALLGRPLAELGDALIDPAALFGGAAGDWVERLLEARGHAARLAILEGALLSRLPATTRLPPDLVWAHDRLVATRGRVAVAALAGEIGCSRKHLTVRFAREFGMAPKLLARVLRFDHAMQRLPDAVSLAEVAHACGYADQSHMVRDVSEFAGECPTGLLRRRLPDDGGIIDFR